MEFWFISMSRTSNACFEYNHHFVCSAYWNSYTGTRQLIKFSVFSIPSISEYVHLVPCPSHHENKCKDNEKSWLHHSNMNTTKLNDSARPTVLNVTKVFQHAQNHFSVTIKLNFWKMFCENHLRRRGEIYTVTLLTHFHLVLFIRLHVYVKTWSNWRRTA